jgi:5-methylthioribose kinase
LFYLKKIEDGELTFYQASYEIGMLLKNMYVDPIIDDKEKEMKKGRNIDWNEYKKINTQMN